jgi:LAO/AO transport system kinase
LTEQSIKKILAGDHSALAAFISLIERDSPQVPEIMKSVSAHTGRAYRIGITGPPGAGKSTLINGLIALLRERGSSVAILAVDPSSPFKGGAILGDRVRMQKHYTDKGVFIRSLATRGGRGGLTWSINQIIDLVDAAGNDYILIETVGVGQSELDIIGHVDTVVVVLMPDAGDSIQTMKAGIMEIADIFVVNKSDLAGANKLVNNLNVMLDINRAQGDWRTPVLKCRADQNDGITALLDQILVHKHMLESSGLLEEKRGRQRMLQFEKMLEQKLLAEINSAIRNSDMINDLEKKIVNGKLSPYAALDRIMKNRFSNLFQKKTLIAKDERSKK